MGLRTGVLVEDRDTPLPAGLRLVHGDVAVADEFLCRLLARLHGDADAGVRPDVDPAEPHRPGQCDGDPAGRCDGVLLVDLLAHDDELVAAEPGHQFARPDGGPEPVGDLDEQLVTGGVAQRVIDDLEVVEVEEQAGEAAGAGAEPLGDVLRQQRAVGQAGQGVVIGLVSELGLERETVGDVLDRPHEAGADPRGEQVGEPDDRRPDGAVLPHQANLGLDLVAVEGGGDLLDDAVQVVLVDGVDPARAEELLGPQTHEAAERVVDVRQAHALLREQGRDGGSLGEGREAPLVRVRGGPQRLVVLVGRGDDAHGPRAATRRRCGHHDRLEHLAAGGPDRQRHLRCALATQQQLQLPTAQGL